MTGDRPLLGLFLMLGFCLLAPAADSVAKLLTARLGVPQLVTIRFILQVAILAPIVWRGRIPVAMRGRVFWLTALRTVLQIAGIGTMYLALRFLDLADAIAIAYVMPFIMLILGRFVLGEEVGHRRILACCAGFIGTLMVMQPSFAEVGWPALLPAADAVIFAVYMLVTRQIAREADPVAIQFVSGLVAVVLLVPLALVPETGWARPVGSEWMLLLLLGVLGTLAHLVMTWSLRYAQAATVAPVQYLEIPVAAAIGWVVFSDFPDRLALAGSAVTVAAGLYIIFREQSLSREPARQAPPPGPPAAE